MYDGNQRFYSLQAYLLWLHALIIRNDDGCTALPMRQRVWGCLIGRRQALHQPLLEARQPLQYSAHQRLVQHAQHGQR